jgi:hypothetical protein
MAKIHDNFRYIKTIQALAKVLPDDQGTFGAVVQHDSWLRMARRLRSRYEIGISYQWADTDEYRAGTIKLESKIRKAVTGMCLFCYLQSDPRGGTLYIGKEPMSAVNYGSHGLFIA